MFGKLKEMQLSEESTKVYERLGKMLDPTTDLSELKKEDIVTIREAVSTQDAKILMPAVITGALREAAEPALVATNMLQKIRLTDGRSIQFPSIGAMRAHFIGESGSYLQESPDFQLHESDEIRVQKAGMMVSVTDELIEDAAWDVLGILVRKAGEAMARLKEEHAFQQFSTHGHLVFDNDLRGKYTEAGTTGRDREGNLNDTLSTEDMIDMFVALLANNKNATDIMMHPLCWSVFFKNDLMQSMGHAALGGSQVTSLKITPDQASGRIPFALNLTFSPYVPFNHKEKKFDMYVVDKGNIGALVEKTPLKTDQFEDPERDIQKIKVMERYGIGVYDEGKGIAVARNIAFDTTWPEPDRIKIVS